MQTLILVLHILAAAGIVVLVLLQHGKGADMGAAFGSGSSGSLFGAAGSANFLSRTTAILAAVFFLSSLGLTWFATTHMGPSGVMQQGVMEKMAPKSSDMPATPGAPAAGPTPADVPKAPAAPPAPTAPASDGSKAGEVPK